LDFARIATSRALLGSLLLLSLLTACDAAAPSAAPTPTPTPVVAPQVDVVTGCIDIEAGECAYVARIVVDRLPTSSLAPFSVEIRLGPCLAEAPCPKSLGSRLGTALIEFPDGAAVPVEVGLAGPASAPVTTILTSGPWSGPVPPGSPRVESSGPFELEVGHCGLLHVVDFDGSYWVPIGQVDGSAPALDNAEIGSIRLISTGIAEYRGAANLTLQLARFPGAKRFRGCD